MGVLLLLGVLAVFGGLWFFFAMLWLMFRITFWFIGGLFGLIAASVGLLMLGAVGLLMLPVLGLLMLPLAFPLLLVLGLVWLLTRNNAPRPLALTIRH